MLRHRNHHSHPPQSQGGNQNGENKELPKTKEISSRLGRRHQSLDMVSKHILAILMIFFILSIANTNMKVLQSLLSWITKRPRQWSNDAMCHTPIKAQIGAVPPLHNTRETRVVNMGMPKSGSTSTDALFKKSGFDTSHWFCGKNRFCGNCIDDYINLQRKQWKKHDHIESLFQRCGDFQVWTQLDIQDNAGNCIFPQIEYLEELYSNAPNATWLMPMRNVTAWINSVNRKDDMRDRFGNCDFRPHLNFAQKDAESDEKMMELYCTHIDQVRDFVKSHPTLSYIEYRIEDSDVGSYLKGYFPSLSESQWEQKNMWYEGREEKKLSNSLKREKYEKFRREKLAKRERANKEGEKYKNSLGKAFPQATSMKKKPITYHGSIPYKKVNKEKVSKVVNYEDFLKRQKYLKEKNTGK